MTITTVDPIVADVMFVTEWHWLSARNSHFREVRGFIEGGESGHHGSEESNAAEDCQARNRVGARMKNLPHVSYNAALSTPHGDHKQRFLAVHPARSPAFRLGLRTVSAVR
jgi:hypothetical protein